MRLIDANIIEHKLIKLIEELEKISDATYHANAFYDTDKHYGRYRDYGHKADGVEIALDEIKAAPTIEEPKKGKWEDKKVSTEKVIDEWQSARCSVCEKYHTTPYMYYFDNFNYCPNCGADMREE